MTIHQQQVHPEFVAGCFMCKVSSVQLNAGAVNSNPKFQEAVNFVEDLTGKSVLEPVVAPKAQEAKV
jgi:hypothetical protein